MYVCMLLAGSLLALKGVKVPAKTIVLGTDTKSICKAKAPLQQTLGPKQIGTRHVVAFFVVVLLC